MYQHFSRPDPVVALCGHLNATVVERHIPGAPEFMRGLRAVFLSDTHLVRRTTRADIEALVAKIAALEPELLLLGGDYSDVPEGAVRLFDALGAIRPPMGCFGVIGNNDAEAWSGRLEALRGVMAKAGCEMLVNGAVRLRRGGGTLHIAGVDEYKYGSPTAEGLYPPLPRPGCYRLLLSHFPHAIRPTPDLMLSGHTHGGQFNLLGVTPFAIGFEQHSKRRRMASMAIAGLHDIDGMKLFISKGVGASRIQLRVGVRPEIDCLVFE